MTTQVRTTDDASTKRADVIAYIAARQGFRALFGRWTGAEPDARYLMLAEGVAYVVAIRAGQETTEERFSVADIEHLTVRRGDGVVTLEFLLRGDPHRIELADDRLVSFADSDFFSEDQAPPLTMADQVVAYLNGCTHDAFARVA